MSWMHVITRLLMEMRLVLFICSGASVLSTMLAGLPMNTALGLKGHRPLLLKPASMISSIEAYLQPRMAWLTSFSRFWRIPSPGEKESFETLSAQTHPTSVRWQGTFSSFVTPLVVLETTTFSFVFGLTNNSSMLKMKAGLTSLMSFLYC